MSEIFSDPIPWVIGLGSGLVAGILAGLIVNHWAVVRERGRWSENSVYLLNQITQWIEADLQILLGNQYRFLKTRGLTRSEARGADEYFQASTSADPDFTITLSRDLLSELSRVNTELRADWQALFKKNTYDPPTGYIRFEFGKMQNMLKRLEELLNNYNNVPVADPQLANELVKTIDFSKDYLRSTTFALDYLSDIGGSYNPVEVREIHMLPYRYNFVKYTEHLLGVYVAAKSELIRINAGR